MPAALARLDADGGEGGPGRTSIAARAVPSWGLCRRPAVFDRDGAAVIVPERRGRPRASVVRAL